MTLNELQLLVQIATGCYSDRWVDEEVGGALIDRGLLRPGKDGKWAPSAKGKTLIERILRLSEEEV